MGERVIADFVPFAVHAFCHVAKFVGLDANQEKRGRHVLIFQNVQDFRCPLRVRTIIKCDRHLFRTITVAADSVGSG